MKYLRLTNACQFFTGLSNEEKLQLSWDTSLNLTPYKFVSLLKIQMGPIKADEHNRLVSVCTNIISRTLHNPLREITCVQVPRRSQFIDSEYVKGQLLKLII